MVDRHSKPLLRPQVVLREESDDWAVLFDPDSGETYGLDPVGVFIAKRLDGSKSVVEIVQELGEHFDGIPPEVDQDALQFVDSLMQKGLAFI